MVVRGPRVFHIGEWLVHQQNGRIQRTQQFSMLTLVPALNATVGLELFTKGFGVKILWLHVK